jgi:hypothetical protein
LSQLMYIHEEETKSLSIDLSYFHNGVYFIKIDENKVKKVVIQH